MNETIELKVSQMQEVTNVNDDDYLMVVQNGTNKKFRIQQILELIFPVGSTYITQEDINPNMILGFGTWERLKGKICVGLDEDDVAFNTIGQTGGEKEHTLTINEMPKHSHSNAVTNGQGNYEWGYNFQYTSTAAHNSGASGSAGGSQPHNNLQPYEVVGYMWIRRS